MRWLSCAQALLQAAGTYVGAPSGGSPSEAFPVDPIKWERFRTWFVKGLKTLQKVPAAWGRTPASHIHCGSCCSD
jgi:hypothetical protein